MPPRKAKTVVDSDIEVKKPASKKSSTVKTTEVVETGPDDKIKDDVIKVKKTPVKRTKKDIADVVPEDDLKVKKTSKKKVPAEIKDPIVVSKDLEIITSNKLNINNDPITTRNETENIVLMNRLDDIKKCWTETIKVIESMKNDLSLLDQKTSQYLKEMIQISKQLDRDETETNSKTVFNFKSNNDIEKKIESINVEKKNEKIQVVSKKIFENDDNKIIDSSDSDSTESSDSDISDNSNKTKKLKTKKLSLKKKTSKDSESDSGSDSDSD